MKIQCCFPFRRASLCCHPQAARNWSSMNKPRMSHVFGCMVCLSLRSRHARQWTQPKAYVLGLPGHARLDSQTWAAASNADLVQAALLSCQREGVRATRLSAHKLLMPNDWNELHRHIDVCMHACIHLYIYICCRVKTWSKNSLFLSQNLVQGFSFFLFLFFKNPLLSAGRMRLLRKTSQKRREKKTLFLRQNLVWFCCATYLDQVLTQPWTKFWLNNVADFWLFLPVWKDAETTIFIVFSAKMKFLSPPQKIKEHYLWTQLR